jgi:hypothetical protein
LGPILFAGGRGRKKKHKKRTKKKEMGVMFKEFNCFVIEIQNKQNNGRWKGMGNEEEVLKIKKINKKQKKID